MRDDRKVIKSLGAPLYGLLEKVPRLLSSLMLLRTAEMHITIENMIWLFWMMDLLFRKKSETVNLKVYQLPVGFHRARLLVILTNSD